LEKPPEDPDMDRLNSIEKRLKGLLNLQGKFLLLVERQSLKNGPSTSIKR